MTLIVASDNVFIVYYYLLFTGKCHELLGHALH